MFEGERLASARAFLHGPVVPSIRSPTSCSNFDLDSFMRRCLGPEASAVTKGRLISVSIAVESSIFALSAASFNLCNAILSFLRSIPWSLLNSSTIQSIILRSKSSPPRYVFPFVDLTSITPSPISRIDMSNVPPPRS